MEKGFLTIDELSKYLGIKKSNLYSKVERREIPFYRFGRLIMFKKEEIDAFMEACRVEIMDSDRETKRILGGNIRTGIHIDRVIGKAIDGVKGREYTTSHGKPDRIKGLGKGVEDGTL